MVAHWVEQADFYFVPLATAVLLPHAAAFFVAHMLVQKHDGAHKGASAEVLPAENEEGPKSFFYIMRRVGPMWLLHLLIVLTHSAGAPSVANDSIATGLLERKGGERRDGSCTAAYQVLSEQHLNSIPTTLT